MAYIALMFYLLGMVPFYMVWADNFGNMPTIGRVLFIAAWPIFSSMTLAEMIKQK